MAGILEILAANLFGNKLRSRVAGPTRNQDPNAGMLGLGEAEMGPMMEAITGQSVDPGFSRDANGGLRIDVNGVGSVPTQSTPPAPAMAPQPTPISQATAGQNFYPPDSLAEMEMADLEAAMPAGSSGGQNAALQPAMQDEKGKKPDLAGILNAVGQSLLLAGSKNPAQTYASLLETDRAEAARTKPKVTPVQNGAFSMITYPDGRTEFVRNDQVAQFIEDTSQAKFMRDIIKSQMAAQAGVDAAAKREASKEQIKTAGDTASTNLNVQELTRIRDALANTDTASGPIIGNMPKFLRDTFFPEGTSLQDSAERIIQSSLRQTLGAQFTAVEGANFLARAYNPRVSEAENARRLGVIIDELMVIQNNKDAALEYMRKNGTLDGFASGVSGAPAAGTPSAPSAPAAPAAPSSVLPKSGKYF